MPIRRRLSLAIPGLLVCGGVLASVAGAAPETRTDHGSSTSSGGAAPLLRRADGLDRAANAGNATASRLQAQAIEALRSASDLVSGTGDEGGTSDDSTDGGGPAGGDGGGVDAAEASSDDAGDDTLGGGASGDDGACGALGAACTADDPAVQELVARAAALTKRAATAAAGASRAASRARGLRDRAQAELAGDGVATHARAAGLLTKARAARTQATAARALAAKTFAGAYGADGLLDEDAVDAGFAATLRARRLDARADATEAAALRLAA